VGHDQATTRHRVVAVVLNYNGGRDTVECVTWLKTLTPDRPRILVVDNASGDDSVMMIRDHHPDIEIVALTDNHGFAGGNNRGIVHCQQDAWEYVWLINNDTRGTPTALAELVHMADADETIGAVGSVLVEYGNPTRILASGAWLLAPFCISWHTRSKPARFNRLIGASLLLRRSALESCGLLDESFFFSWEDVELSTRLRRHGWKLAMAEESRVEHKEGGTAAALTPFRLYHHARGIVLFARRQLWLPWLSAVFACGLSFANCLLFRRRPDLAREVYRGWKDGWDAPLVAMPLLDTDARVNQ